MIFKIKALQAEFIANLNDREYEKVVAAFHESYAGLEATRGYLTLDARKAAFKKRFSSDDSGLLCILETDVRPLGHDYALLRSHLRKSYINGKDPEDWWYTAIYFRVGCEWQVIHEQ